jgi:hypothetical protein
MATANSIAGAPRNRQGIRWHDTDLTRLAKAVKSLMVYRVSGLLPDNSLRQCP